MGVTLLGPHYKQHTNGLRILRFALLGLEITKHISFPTAFHIVCHCSTGVFLVEMNSLPVELYSLQKPLPRVR